MKLATALNMPVEELDPDRSRPLGPLPPDPDEKPGLHAAIIDGRVRLSFLAYYSHEETAKALAIMGALTPHFTVSSGNGTAAAAGPQTVAEQIDTATQLLHRLEKEDGKQTPARKAKAPAKPAGDVIPLFLKPKSKADHAED